ncbi:hypothetical protein V9K67_02545 [Paraflavisolibacter sp. H34]|uniref:hypothetical protein n=1 Tax=Huijunlia imazamoxiresistens TaxID=3127457 RepID=UPI003018AB52
MSLNNIQLHPGLLAALYPDVLVETAAAAAPAPALPYLGGNKKQITIVVPHEMKVFPVESELAFLTNILAACKLTLADVALVQLPPGAPLTYEFLRSELQSKAMLLFELAPDALDLPFHFPFFQLQEFDGCTYLAAPALKEIEKDKATKQKLWGCLKTLFNL